MHTYMFIRLGIGWGETIGQGITIQGRNIFEVEAKLKNTYGLSQITFTIDTSWNHPIYRIWHCWAVREQEEICVGDYVVHRIK